MDITNSNLRPRPQSVRIEDIENVVMGQSRQKSNSVSTERQKASHIIFEESDTESEGEVSRNRNNEFFKKSKAIKISLTKQQRE